MEPETALSGRLLLSTPVYGDRSFVNVALSDGSIGVVRHDYHLEIWQTGAEFRVFDVTVSHSPDAASRVVRAQAQGSFASIGAAATFAMEFTSSYHQAAREDLADRRELALRRNADEFRPG